MSLKATIAAVIVTFNRRDKLEKVIEALKGQTHLPDKVFVVDNASTDGTADYLAALESSDNRFEHVRLPENIGGAGGFYEGARTAFDGGYDYIWLSDDDAYPNSDAIEILLSSLFDFQSRFGHKPAFACSNVKWMNGDHCEMNTPSTVWDWPRYYTEQTPYFLVGSCSFVSVLIPRWAFAKHGFPIKDYFIWYDDAEFTQRIARSHPGIFCPKSLVHHDVPENKGVNFSLVTDDNLWKFKYGARNEASFRMREHGWLSVVTFFKQVREQFAHGHVAKHLRRSVYKSIWEGTRFKPEIVMPEKR